MPTIQGPMSKMHAVVDTAGQVAYQLPLGDQLCDLNPLIGQKVQLEFTQKIACTYCGAAIKKAYQQGYCFLATQKLAQCDMCILKPEQCHHHLGTCREPDWGNVHCMADHIVYLAYASGIKVGITRKKNIPSRWIDQGATIALPIFKVATRRIAGLIEVELAKHIADKTNWRKMLQNGAHHQNTDQIDLLNITESVDLKAKQAEIIQEINDKITQFKTQFGPESIEILEEPERHFYYPVESVPEKITAFNFDKDPIVKSKLTGVKGQYLIFEDKVLNIRKFTGYEIKLSAEQDFSVSMNPDPEVKSGVCPFQ